ncbi:hypothetical protein FSP39_024681 [Pinctada imbricata]|uniref:Histone-lysine N-methyltransferase SETMAR n=1 Tax=Pinctada imbricata TaxID=66713 RepID=A0AA88YSS3_PINIB|nr:hypothetical protein FSP39_024681 [Pinctada imbricata]
MQMLKNSFIKPVFECNRNCLCSLDCTNRVVQHGVKLKLEIYESPTKGLCLRTLEHIRCGHFVCQYAGEIISYKEAKKRILKQTSDSMNYILVVTEHCASGPVMTVVDPTHYGNIGRYINHSCTPNLSLLPVRIDITTPVIALFATRDIEPYEELSFDYGSSDLIDSPRSEGECKSLDKNMKKCHCQSEQCKGFLPFHADLFQA